MADLIEIEVAFYGQDRFSREDAIRLAYENDEPDDRGDDDDDPPDDASDDAEASTAELSAGKQARADIWFSHLAYRAAQFADNYPFELRDNLLRRRPLTAERQFYLLLLICSRLALIKKATGNRQRLASLFETVCMRALQRMAPTMTVRIFGANSADRRTHFGSTAKEAFATLANDLCEEITQSAVDDLPKGTGERGIDLVAHYPWNDNANGCFAVLAQCAAQSEEWPAKALEAYPPRHAGVINFRHMPSNVLFIPLCYRKPSGEWVRHRDPWLTILVDRVRLFRALEGAIPGDLAADAVFGELLRNSGLVAA